MSRLKYFNDRRIIVDLSFEGDDSVNGCMPRGVDDGHSYLLTIIVGLSHILLMSTENSKLTKVDIAYAFCTIQVDSGNPLKLYVSCNYDYFIDKLLIFSTVNDTAMFQTATGAIRCIISHAVLN